ncbi:Ca-activated chloride channel family protein [Halpernia humi]|uniref:Ca-activated chloride channel family protein n=1 Tax=Halpernia humi TaxID=493375 RepID=A0A1H5SGA9_9FLAO|nr:VWA domain-containing protein [Halpernia humi]SEF49649.1 Ca-activated chloride channel family protein [Halpernia humi]
MENNFENIDKKFSEASDASDEKLNTPEFENIWNKIEEKLDQKETKRRILPIWLPYGIAASLLIGSGIFYFNSKNSVETEKLQIAVNKDFPVEKPIENPENRKIDETIKSNIAKEKAVEKTNVIAMQVPTATKNPEIIQPSVPQENENLAYEAKNKEIEIAEKSKIAYSESRIKAEKNASRNNIDGVIVTAMGIKREQKSLGYATTNPSSQLQNAPNYNVKSALQGKVAGLEINPSVGNPGSNPNLIIRGVKSLNDSSKPLIVVDGNLMSENDLNNINPNKIKYISVLKDASATALYGSRGLNGVILIKTKNLTKEEKQKIKELKINKNIPVQNNEEYDAFIENPFESAKNEPLSTFSIDVDNAAYSNIRRMINNGQKVDKNAVRIEEMLNYFKYYYPQPTDNKPFSVNTEYSDAAWNPQHKLLKIGLQGKNIPLEKLPNSNIVFLIDVSGSMSSANKLPLLKSSFKVLLDKMKPEDKVGIVVYAGNAGMVLEPTSVKNKEKIIAALDNLQAGGSTAGGAGIELAYKLAQENFIKNGNNRVIIATDGDFNVGTSSTKDLGTLIEEKRKSGVFLTCLGFGMGNYKDNTLETLADKGNGSYAYIDNMQEANKFLGKEFAGSMYAIAKDVKIQIEFNPKYVKSYRLIGYENRKLNNEDFIDDKKDAGELGSGHTVTALYEIIPVGVNSEFDVKEIPLKYTNTKENSQNFGDELATIKLRYKKPDEDKSVEMQQIVKNSATNFAKTSEDFKFASAVSWFGLVLRDSKYIKDKNLDEIINLAKQGLNKDEDGYRAEFVRLVESYNTIK